MLELDEELYDLMYNLVTDRTAEDVEAVEVDEDYTVWRGMYTFEDANRVETTVKALAKKLEGLEAELKQYAAENGYKWKDEYKLEYESKQARVTTKTDWGYLGYLNKADAKRYLENVARMCVLLNVHYYTLPPNMVGLDYKGANEIERLLYECFIRLAYLIQWKKAQIAGADSYWSYLAYIPCDNKDAYEDTNGQIFCVRREALIDYETQSFEDYEGEYEDDEEGEV